MASSVESMDFPKLINQTINNASTVYSTSPKLTCACMISLIFFAYYYKKVVKTPRLISGSQKFKQFLTTNCRKTVTKPIYPTVWAFQPHVQTILANVIRNTLPKLKFERETLVTADGGEISLDWYKDDERSKDEPIVILMPGLTGDSKTEYITSLVPVVYSTGARVCVMINRGRGGMELKTPRLYCAANCEDAEQALNHLRSSYPNSKLFAIGISLGGIVLGRYLTEKGDKAVVDAAMLISVCYELFSACESLQKNRLNLFLNKHLSRSLASILNGHRSMLELNENLDFNTILKCTTLRELDEHFTCKMWGFETVDDYYLDGSLKDRLQNIKKPVLCLNAEDDMFMPKKALPIEKFEQSSHLALLLTSRGGHIGFMDKLLGQMPFFTERLVKEYISALNKFDFKKESIC